jgi:E3 ubiquitin-protein ligase makorin
MLYPLVFLTYISCQVCTFYQKGACAYGSHCRYDHVEVSHNRRVLPPPPSSNTASPVASTLQLLSSSHPPQMGHQKDSSNETQQTSMNMMAHSASKPAWRTDFQPASVSEDEIDWSANPTEQNLTPMRPVDLPSCSFAAAGNCP